MRTANNNFTVKNLVDKYHNYVSEHCSYNEVYIDEVGVEKVPLTYGSEDLLVSIYTTITGKSADSRILEALSSYAKEYKEKYSNVLTEEEYAFLCENFAEVCDICFQYLENDQWHYREESVYTSEEIELIREHLTPKPGSTIFVANSRLCINANLFPNCKFKGCTTMSDTVTDTDRYSWALAQIKLFSMGIESNILPCINGCLEEDYVSDVDYVIWNNPHSESFEDATIIFQKLNPQAKMFILMDKQYAAGKKGEAYELRKFLVESRAIESIVLFYKKQYDFYLPKICVVADKSGCNTVQLNSQLSSVSKEVLETSLDYEILWPGYYMASRPKNGIPLSNLVKYERLSHLKERDNWITNFEPGRGHTLLEEAKSMPVVSISDLAKDYKDANMCTKDLKPACDPLFSEKNGSLRSLKEPCVLLFGFYGTYSLGYIKDIPMTGICTLNFIECLIPQKGIDVRYIAALLLSPEVKEQIATVCDGDFSSISSFILEKIIVPNHTDKERLAFLSEANYEAMNSICKGLEEAYKEKYDTMKTEYINEVRMRKHDMRPHLRQLASSERLMIHFIDKCKDLEELKKQMSSQLVHTHEAIVGLSNIVDHLANEDKFGKPELLNLDKLLEEIKVNHKDCEDFIIKYDCNRESFSKVGLILQLEETNEQKCEMMLCKQYYKKRELPLFIEIAPVDFQRLVTNIFDNARNHGFTDYLRSDYYISIVLSYNSEREMYQIDFCNNGNPLPIGMTKERFGIRGEKAGEHGGTGNGGYIIKSIVSHYGGDFDVFSKDGVTVIRIYLPIKN